MGGSPPGLSAPARPTLRRRLASLAYESLLLASLLAVAWFLPQLLLAMAWGLQTPAWASWLSLFILPGVYFSHAWQRRGQTLAMQTWKLKLVDARSGGSISLGQAWLRYALAWLSLATCGAGFLWALVDRDRQFLHDRLGNTRITFFPPTRSSPPPAAGTGRSG